MSFDAETDCGPLPTFDHLSIVTAPHPALDTPSLPIEAIDASVRLLAVRMEELMRRGVDGVRGVGLAANQVNVLRRLIVIDIAGNKHERAAQPRIVTRGPLVMINPVFIAEPASRRADGEERSLSHPGVKLSVHRWDRVAVIYTDVAGKPMTFDAGGLLARCIQHLVDALDGISIEERVRLDNAAAAAEGAIA